MSVRLQRNARSPLIGGSMSPRTPLWRDWLAALAIGFVISYGAIIVASRIAPVSDFLIALHLAWIPSSLGSALGAWIGVKMAQAADWHGRREFGILVGVVLAFASAYFYALYLL